MSRERRDASDSEPLPTIDWEACLAAHQPWLRKVILARTGEPAAVEEVLQLVALAALDRRAPLLEPSKAAAWLHRVAVIQSARYRRQCGRRRRAIRGAAEHRQHLENGKPLEPLAWLIKQERHDLTRLAVARLPGRDAEILLLKYGERWSYRQIAERLGISEKAVDARLLRARQRLRQELAALGIDENDAQ
jgi:RNA polymerase sigma-70 factor (ECF subfamily)